MTACKKTNLQIVAKQFTLGKNERLKSRKTIERIFSEGKRFVVAPFRIHYIIGVASSNPGIHMGVSAPTRLFKKAVDRNRVKRLVREAWRLKKKEFSGLVVSRQHSLDLMIMYNGKEIPAYKFVCEKMDQIIIKLTSLVNENNIVHT